MSQIEEISSEAVARPKSEILRKKEKEEERRAQLVNAAGKLEYWREVCFPAKECGDHNYYEDVRGLMVKVDHPDGESILVETNNDEVCEVSTSEPQDADSQDLGVNNDSMVGKSFYLTESTMDEFLDSDDDDISEMSYSEQREYEKAMKSGLVRYIVSPRFCRHQQREYIKCACMCRMKVGKDKYLFEKESLDDLLAMCYELRLRQFTHSKSFEAGEHYHKHFVTVICLTTRDKFLLCDPIISRDKFLTLVYELRTHYGLNYDMGERETLSGCNFEAQSIGDFMKKIFSVVKEGLDMTVNSARDLIKKIFSKIVDSLKFALGMISDTIGCILERILKMLRRILIKIIDPIEMIKENLTVYGGLIVVISVVTICLMIEMLGFLAMKFAGRVIDTLIRWFKNRNSCDDDSDSDNEAQGPSDPVAGFITLICLVLGLSCYEMTVVSKRCREFTSLVAGGLAGSMLIGSLFLVLPVAVQTALKMKYGSIEEKERVVIDDWMIRANAVTRLKKIPKVLVSKEYRQWLTELITEAQGLRTKIKTGSTANVFVRLLVSMMEILAMLENYDMEKSYRDYPFSLHISAPAGYGKTLFVSKFMRDLFMTDERDVYTRPINDEFWSGFINQKIVLFDEFLIGDYDHKLRHALEYLEIVSTKVFKPPLASVDDIAVGLKGTRCEPVGVVTINNTAYSKITNIDENTIYRRRHHVIKVGIKPGFEKFMKDSTLNLSAMTDQQIKDIDWLEFEMLPCSPNTNQVGITLNYTQMVTFLRAKLGEHQRTCARIKTGLNDEVNEDLTPTQLLENAMRELRGVTNEPRGLTESLFDLLSDTKDGIGEFFKFTSQGPGNEPTQTMDERSRVRPRKDTEEFKMYRILKNTRSGTSKSKEGVLRRLSHVKEWLENLPDVVVDEETSRDRSMVRALLRLKRRDLQVDIEVPGLSSDEQFESCSDTDEPVTAIQKDVISDIAHTNVNPELMHRHGCLGMWSEIAKDSQGNELRTMFGKPVMRTFRCDKNFAHKHDAEEVHGFLCKTCKDRDARESFIGLHGGPRYTSQKLVRTNESLLPDNYECCYMGESQDYHDKMNKLWTRIIVDKYLSFGYIPYVLFDNLDRELIDSEGTPNIYIELNPNSMIKNRFKSMVKWVSIYVVIIAACKLVTQRKDMPNQIKFGAESPKANKERNKSKSKSVKTFTRAHAQSGGGLTFEIDGRVHNGIPIKGQTFMTYYHSILREDGQLVPNGSDMRIRWKNYTETVKFDISMTQSCADNDLLFITYCCKKIPHFPDRVKQFWSVEDIDNFEATSGTINLDDSPKYVTIAKAKNKNYSFNDRKFELDECLMYRYPTMKGDCGTTVTSCGQHYPGKILGMHIAGGSHKGDSFGLAVIVTREDIEEALKIKTEEQDLDISFTGQGPDLLEKAPNLRKLVQIPLDEVIHLNRDSKIRQSAICEDLPWMPLKNKPIMSRADPRAGGVDPMIKALNVALDVNHDESTIDEELLQSCAEATLNNYRHKLVWPVGKRRLTFEEALQGIPGKLCSMKVKTSAGYPLCKATKKKGKTEYFKFGPEGLLWYDPNFRLMCEEYVQRMESEGVDERRFVAYLKDELVSDSKVLRVKTRIIYAGDMISNVAYRMVFGSLLTAFNASFQDTPSAVGMNQYSHDMHMMYDYLSEVGHKNFVAGDIDEWDKHQMRPVLRLGYWVWEQLAQEMTNEIGLKSFYKQQNFSPAQFSDRLIYFVVTYFSGLFLTTIMNNITHENHIRYIFAKRNPTKLFDEHVRVKLGGDDHIYNFSDEVADNMTPFKIRETFKELGHVYTSDSKDEELKDEFRKFEDITFLGAHPVLINGKYCGALKKKTLEEMVCWTKNRNQTLRDECKMAMELASIWGEKYYTYFVDSVNFALHSNDFGVVEMPCCSEMQRIVASRTAASGEDFPFGFFAQGPPVNSLAKLNEHKLVDGVQLNVHQPDRLASKAVNEGAMNVDFGTESRVYRGQFDWTTADVPGVPIFSVDVPFGILSLGDADNVQNMGFDRFVYWKGDIELSFQINATPFQQGLLVAYFVPLAAYPVELANITTCSHVKIQPDQSSTYTLTIPYLFLRSVMNTIARTTESLGTLYVTPLSALQAVDNDTVTLTVYSAYPGSKFTIPRPLDAEPGRNKFYTVTGLESISEMVSFEGPFEAQGNSSSTSISNYWNAGGDMPIESISNTAGAEAHQDLSADVSIPMPLDNPPLASGALPVVQHLTSMSASHGVRPTTDLQLKPATLARQQMDIFNPAETKFETLLAHQCLLTKFSVASDTPIGTELYKITLNTRMGIAEGTNIPINIAVLNQFIFWRCDVELTFVSVQTKFHSVRLQALMAYGAPGLVLGSRNVNYSSNMNFAPNDESTNYVHTEVIPYNAQTEFLRTYEGETVTDPIQNYSLGTFGVYVLNSLIAPPTVPGAVEILVFLRFLNPKLAVPRPNSPFTWNGYLEYTPAEVFGFRGSTSHTEGRRAYNLDVQAITNFPFVDFTSGYIQWSEGIVAPAGVYNLVTPRNLTFAFYRGSALGTIMFERLVAQVQITGTIMYFLVVMDPIDGVIQPTSSYVVTDDFIFMTPVIPMMLEVDETSVIRHGEECEFEAQGPTETVTVEEVNPSGTGENTDEAERIVMTKEETPFRPNKPCKWEIGEKFEFTISDIHEIGRRYIRVIPITNEALDQFAVLTRTGNDDMIMNHMNVPVQPQNMWRGLFAAWAGSVKFRIFRNNEGFLPQVIFVPYYNKDVSLPGLPIIDAMVGYEFVAYSTAYTSVSSITGPLAREVMYPISGTNYIDVSAPFQSHYNFCYNSKTQAIAPISSGTLTMSYGNDQIPIIFTAFGDDLRLGVYRPPMTTTFNMTVFRNGIGGFSN